jgi:hypothetical protein
LIELEDKNSEYKNKNLKFRENLKKKGEKEFNEFISNYLNSKKKK